MGAKSIDVQSTDWSSDIALLAKSVQQSKALHNAFYDQWSTEKVTAVQFCIFARNYREFTAHFPSILASLIVSITNVEARIEFVKTLYSEMGQCREEKVHSTLFEKMAGSLSAKLGGANTWDSIEDKYNVLPSTHAFLKTQSELYTDAPEIAVGAQLAQEWQAYTMVRKLYEGFRQYKSLWDNSDAFHEDCEFFYAHIGEAEKEHKIESLRGAIALTNSDEDFNSLESGFSKLLNAYIAFWHGIHEAMKNS